MSILDIQTLILLHRLYGFALDALEELLVGGDIVNKPDDLTSGPDL